MVPPPPQVKVRRAGDWRHNAVQSDGRPATAPSTVGNTHAMAAALCTASVSERTSRNKRSNGGHRWVRLADARGAERRDAYPNGNPDEGWGRGPPVGYAEAYELGSE